MANITADGVLAVGVGTKDRPPALNIGGTWGGGSITWEYAPNNEASPTWLTLNVDAIDADGVYEIPVSEEFYQVRPTLAGATSPNLVYEWLGAG